MDIIQKISEKINVILDLDDVLINYPETHMSKVHIFFEPYTLILTDDFGNYYICPAYIIEFMKYINEYFDISFFSAGDKDRNEAIIEKLWQSRSPTLLAKSVSL